MNRQAQKYKNQNFSLDAKTILDIGKSDKQLETNI